MMNEEILREINSLPPDAQRQLKDFVSFLHERYKESPLPKVADSELETEAFVGMWQDREDMDNGSTWVRNIRQTHWRK